MNLSTLSSLAIFSLYGLILMSSAGCTMSDPKVVTAATADLKKIPDLELWVSAEDLAGKDGSAVTTWPDRTPHHWDLKSAGGKHTLATRGINGRPAVWFDGSLNGKDPGPFGAMLTDAKFFDSTWTGQMSVFIVARQDIDPGPEFHQVGFWSAEAPKAREKIAGLFYDNRNGFWMNCHWVKDLWHGMCSYPMDVNIHGVAFNGKELTTWINGIHFDTCPLPGNPELRGPLCLGNHILYHNGFCQFGGYIAEVLVYKRGLTNAECDTVYRYLQNKYGMTGRQIVLEGHSQLNTLTPQLEKRLPGWQVNNANIGGTGLHWWVTQIKERFGAAHRPGVQNIILVAGGDNTVGMEEGQVETAEQNYRTWATTLRAMGWKTIVSTTPPRTPHKDYPFYGAHRIKLNQWLREHYKEFADGLYDIDKIEVLSDTGNPKYYKPDGVHLTNEGYELTADEIAKVVKQIAGE